MTLVPIPTEFSVHIFLNTSCTKMPFALRIMLYFTYHIYILRLVLLLLKKNNANFYCNKYCMIILKYMYIYRYLFGYFPDFMWLNS